MKKIDAPLKLDVLDDDHVLFTGTDEEHVSKLTFFGEVEGTRNWPAVALPRAAWEELGCPTVLLLSLELVESRL